MVIEVLFSYSYIFPFYSLLCLWGSLMFSGKLSSKLQFIICSIAFKFFWISCRICAEFANLCESPLIEISLWLWIYDVMTSLFHYCSWFFLIIFTSFHCHRYNIHIWSYKQWEDTYNACGKTYCNNFVLLHGFTSVELMVVVLCFEECMYTSRYHAKTVE
jgi:hypothetical protein